jgi:hypothetical protein
VWDTIRCFTRVGSSHRFCSIEIVVYTRREPWWDKIPAWLYYILHLLDFHSTNKSFFAVHLKRSNFGLQLMLNPYTCACNALAEHVCSLYVYGTVPISSTCFLANFSLKLISLTWTKKDFTKNTSLTLGLALFCIASTPCNCWYFCRLNCLLGFEKCFFKPEQQMK